MIPSGYGAGPLLTYRVKGGYSGQTNPEGFRRAAGLTKCCLVRRFEACLRATIPVLVLPVVAGAHEWIAGARTWNHLAAVDGDLTLGVPAFCVVNTWTRTLKR